MSSSKEDVKDIINQGITAYKKNDYTKALELFDEILKIEPQDIVSLNYKGMTLRRLGKFDEAMKCFNSALNINPNYTMTMLNKARLLRLEKKFDLALFIYEDILDIEPEHPLALDESEKVRNLLSRSAHLEIDGENVNDITKEENEFLKNRKKELIDFLDESQNSILDSIDKIIDLLNQQATKEAVIHRDKIVNAINSFNEQLLERIDTIGKDFNTIDFDEECRELLEKWEHFKEIELNKLQTIQ